jgi:peptidoglycan/xylan/chitin deacetylase (PgdA/CDA1 family)
MSLRITPGLEAQEVARALDTLPRWRMPLLLRLSLALHVLLLVALAARPQAWAWLLGAMLFNHLLVVAVGLWPRSDWLGANMTRLPAAATARREIALTIDDGPHPDITPQVLDLLDRHGVKATFFCVGAKAAQHAELCRNIVERGHAVENHSDRHSHSFSLMGRSKMRREIQAGQDTLTRITGRRPEFFRPPAGLRNVFLDPLLSALGLRLVAWSRRGYDTRTADAAIVARRLLHDLKPGAILLLHDDNCARTAAGIPVVLEVLPILIRAAQRSDLRFTTLPAALRS